MIMINSVFSSILQAVSARAEGGLFDFNATLPVMSFQILLLMLILNFLFYNPIEKIITGRDKSIRDTLTKASEILTKADTLTTQYDLELNQEKLEAQAIIISAQKRAQEILAMEIRQAQKETAQLVAEATNQLHSQKEKALKVLEEQVNTLSEHIKNKLLSKQLT